MAASALPIVVFIVIVVVVSGGGEPIFETKVSRSVMINSATQRLWFEVKNIGSEAGTANCLINAYDPQVRLIGRDEFSAYLKKDQVYKDYVDFIIPNEAASITTTEITCD